MGGILEQAWTRSSSDMPDRPVSSRVECGLRGACTHPARWSGRAGGTVGAASTHGGDTHAVRLSLTRQGDYAVRAMLALAAHPADDWLSVPTDQRRDAHSRAGPAAGDDRARPRRSGRGSGRAGPAAIGWRDPPMRSRLLDVISAVEPEPDSRACILRGVSCGIDGGCAVHDVFAEARAAMLERLATVTLDRPGGDAARLTRWASQREPAGPPVPARTGPFGPSRTDRHRRRIHMPRTYVFPRLERSETMRRSIFLSTVLLTIAALVGACAGAQAPTWTFPPAGVASTVTQRRSPAPPTLEPGAPERPPSPASWRSTRSTSGSRRTRLTVDAPGRYAVTLKNTGAVAHDLTFPDGATTGSVDAGAVGDGRGRRPGDGPRLHLLGPGPCGGRDAGHGRGQGCDGRGRDDHGGPCPDTGTVEADPNARRPSTRSRRDRAEGRRRGRPTTSTWSSRRSR